MLLTWILNSWEKIERGNVLDLTIGQALFSLFSFYVIAGVGGMVFAEISELIEQVKKDGKENKNCF